MFVLRTDSVEISSDLFYADSMYFYIYILSVVLFVFSLSLRLRTGVARAARGSLCMKTGFWRL